MDNASTMKAMQELIMFLKTPIEYEQTQDYRQTLNSPPFKRFKTSSKEDPDLILRTMEFISKNIQTLDVYKIGISCKFFSELMDITTPSIFTANFFIGIFIRNLILADRYIFKSLNYIENIEIWQSAPEEIKAWKSMDSVIETTSIILSTNINSRTKIRENKNYLQLVSKLKTFIKPLEEIYNIFKLTDNEEILVIHPYKQIGFTVLLTGIQNNFHFLTLLQNELFETHSIDINIKGAINKDAVLVAKGIKKFDIDRKIPDASLWGIYSIKAFYDSEKNGIPLTSNKFINGKQSPQTLPGFKGKKIVVILDQPQEPLHWDTSEFRPLNQHLTSEVKITGIISRNDVTALLHSILN